MSGRRGLIAALLLVALLIAATVPPAGSQGRLGLGEGLWRVVFFYQAQNELGGVDIDYSAHGSAVLDVAEGSTTGEWNLSVRSQILGTNATSNAVAIGAARGDSISQDLELTEVTVTDASVGLTVTFRADELPDAGAGSFVATGSGCSAVTGTWLIPFSDQLLRGEFIAQRLGTGGAATDADFRDEGLRLIEDARSGTIDAGALRAFIERAELGSEATARDSGCEGDSARLFGTAATLMLDTVLVETGYAARDLDDAAFVDFYRVVLRSGLFEVYPDTRLTWEFDLLQRLADAITSDDPADWSYWLPVARQLGEDEAAIELAQNICEEQGGDCGEDE